MSFHNMFFKILARQNFQEELMINKSFVKKYWKGLSNPILLKLPVGVEQKVYWTKRDDDNIWLNEGWEKVVELCCLKYEYLVLFKYNGGSSFEVIMFDKSAGEINYSSLRCGEETKDCEVGNDECIEIDERAAQFRKRKKTNTGATRRSLHKIRTNSETTLKKKQLEESQCSKTLRRAEAFCSKLKNPSFIREMKPSYVQHDLLRIPIWFSREYLSGLQGRAKIGVCGDMTWSVKLRFCNERATINAGWKSFCQKYELEDGDVCVFEMTQVTPPSFKIEIIRARKEPSSDQLQDQQNHDKPGRGRAQNMERDNGELGKRKRNDGISSRFPKRDLLEKSRSPSIQANQFKIQIKEYHLRGSTVHIPKEFMKRHVRCCGNLVLLQVGKKSWPVKVLYRGVFSEGWPAFVRGCKLDAGDLCLFEMIDEENLVLEVSISRELH